MSMVYDPVTREFRPREARGIKPAAREEGGVPQATGVNGTHRSRRWHGLRRLRRRRETLFWLLVVTVSGALIWCTLLIQKNLMPHYQQAERPIIDRAWTKALE